MIFTKHAAQRWKERCDGLSPLAEWETSVLCRRKLRAILRALCPAHARYLTKSFKGRYQTVSPNGVVFIVTPPEVVITVFRIDPSAPGVDGALKDGSA